MDDEARYIIMKTAIKLVEEGHKPGKVLETIKILYGQWQDATLVARDGMQMYESLVGAVSSAGGACWSVDDLCQMTVMNLISRLATNKVRFYYSRQ